MGIKKAIREKKAGLEENLYEIGLRIYGDPNLFYNNLNISDKPTLDRLIQTTINFLKDVKKRKLEFSITKVKQLSKDKRYKFAIHFVDNFEGRTLLFIPTYDFAIKMVGEEAHIGGDNGIYNITIKNRIVSHFKEFKSGLGIADFEIPDSPPKITFLRPESYIENNGITMLTNNKEDFERNVESFKKRLLQQYIPSKESPILTDINLLLEKGYRVYKKVCGERKIKKDIKTCKNLIGKKI